MSTLEGLWIISPLVLIPLVIWALPKKKKLEKFISQLYSEKRISLIEYTNRETEASKKVTGLFPTPYYMQSVQSHQTGQAPGIGSFIGPPLPPEILAQRRAAAQEETQSVQPAKPLPEKTAESIAEHTENVQPAAGTAGSFIGPPLPPEILAQRRAAAQEEAQSVQPAKPLPEKTAESIAEHTENVQPAAGTAGSFIGPPLPPEILAQRRAAAQEEAQSAQPEPDLSFGSRNGTSGASVPKPSVPGQYIPQKKKRSVNPASAMLVIGSALIIIAGIIFSTAKWSDMNDWQRTGLIAMTAAFFFGVSAVAHKKLKLENTGMAFYMLGSVFSAITFVTVGYFGLLGSWLSVGGKGYWMLYSLAALVVTLFSAGAVKLYRKGAFVHAVLYGGLCSFTLMSLQLFGDSPDVWALFLNVIAAVPIYLLYKQKLRFGSEMYDDQMKLFTAVIAVIYAASALPFMFANIAGGWTIPCFLILLVWIVQAAVYGSLLNNGMLLILHTLLTAAAVTELALSVPGIKDETRLLIFGITVFAAAAVYRYVPKIRSSLSDVLFPFMLFSSLFASNRAAQSDGQLLTCMCLLVGICLMHTLSKEKTNISRGFMTILPLTVLTADFGAFMLIMWNTELYDGTVMAITAGIVFAQALVFTFAKPVRTILSDAVFPLALLVIYSICAGSWVNPTESVMTFITGTMLMLSVLIHACEDPGKRMVRQYVYALPFGAILFAQGAAALANGLSEGYHGEAMPAFVFGCAVFAGAVAMRFVPRLRTRFSDYLNTAAVIIMSVYILGEAEYVYEYWFAAGLAGAALLLVALQCFDRKLERAPVFAGVMPLVSIYLAGVVSCASVRTAAPEANETRELSFSLIFMLICFAAAFIFMNVKRIRSAVSVISFPIAEMCCGLYLLTLYEVNTSLIAMPGFVLMGVMMLIQNSEKDLVTRAVRYFLWVPFVGISASASLAIGLNAETGGHSRALLFAVLFLVLFGLAFRYSKNVGANVRTIASDAVFTVLSAVFAVVCCAEKPFFGIFAAAAAALLVLANITERKPVFPRFVLASRWQFPCMLILLAFTVSEAVRTATERVYLLYPTEGELVPNLVLIFMLSLMSAFFLKIRKIRTLFSDFAIPAALASGIFYGMDGFREDLRIASFVGMMNLCFMLLVYALEKDAEPHLVIHRFAAPAAMFIGTGMLGSVIWTENIPKGLDDMAAFFTGSVISAAAAAVFTVLAEKTGEKRFTQSQYLWAALAGVMLFPAGLCSGECVAAAVLGIFQLTLCAALYLLCGRQRMNYAGVIPLLAMTVCAGDISRQIGAAAGFAEDGNGIFTAVHAAEFIIFCCLSRLINRGSVLIKYETRTTVDFAAFAMLAAPFVTLFAEDSPIPLKWRQFIAVLEFGIFFLNLIRKDHDRRTNLIMLTFAAAMGCTLIYARPFLLTDNVMLKAKIDLIPLILFSILVRIIWKEDKKLASDMSFVVQLAAFAVLLLDALTHQSLANTIIVLCVTLTIMLVSFAAKSGRWFAISAASFLGLTVYITRGFIEKVEWWVYLLTAGLILIAVASVNEYLKSRGQSLKDAGKSFLSRWKDQ